MYSKVNIARATAILKSQVWYHLGLINNAKLFIKIQEQYGSFDKYIWNFVDNQPVINHWESISQVPATSDLSDLVSKDLKNKGFKFLGTTIIYAHLQATGIINDHLTGCYRYGQ